LSRVQFKIMNLEDLDLCAGEFVHSVSQYGGGLAVSLLHWVHLVLGRHSLVRPAVAAVFSIHGFVPLALGTEEVAAEAGAVVGVVVDGLLRNMALVETLLAQREDDSPFVVIPSPISPILANRPRDSSYRG